MNDLGVKIKDYSEMRVLLCTIIQCNFDKLLKADDVTDCVFNVAWLCIIHGNSCMSIFVKCYNKQPQVTTTINVLTLADNVSMTDYHNVQDC